MFSNHIILALFSLAGAATAVAVADTIYGIQLFSLILEICVWMLVFCLKPHACSRTPRAGAALRFDREDLQGGPRLRLLCASWRQLVSREFIMWRNTNPLTHDMVMRTRRGCRKPR